MEAGEIQLADLSLTWEGPEFGLYQATVMYTVIGEKGVKKPRKIKCPMVHLKMSDECLFVLPWTVSHVLASEVWAENQE